MRLGFRCMRLGFHRRRTMSAKFAAQTHAMRTYLLGKEAVHNDILQYHAAHAGQDIGLTFAAGSAPAVSVAGQELVPELTQEPRPFETEGLSSSHRRMRPTAD